MDLTYLLRSGEPVVYDKHMAIYYAHMAMSALTSGLYDVMAAYRAGSFIHTDIPGKQWPARRVNLDDYDAQNYLPQYSRITGPYLPQI